MGLLLAAVRENTYHGELGCLSTRGCSKETVIGLGLWLGNFGEDLWNQRFGLDWILSKNKDNSMNEHLNKSHVQGGHTRAKTKPESVKW